MDNINSTQLPLNILAQVVGSSASPTGLPVQLQLVNAIPANIDPNMAGLGQHFISTTAVSGFEAALSQHFIGSLGPSINSEIGQHFLISSGTPIDLNHHLAQQIISAMEAKSEGTLHNLVGLNQSIYTSADHYSTSAGMCADISQALIESTSSGAIASSMGIPVSGRQYGRVMESKLDLLSVENLLQDSQRFRGSAELEMCGHSNEELFINTEQVLPHVTQDLLNSTAGLDDFTKLSSVSMDIETAVSCVAECEETCGISATNFDKKVETDDDYNDNYSGDNAENSMNNEEVVETNKSDDDIDENDCKSEILSIADKIRLLKKELGAVRRKKSSLMKEVEKMSLREQELQRLLDDQNFKRNRLRDQSKSAVTSSTVSTCAIASSTVQTIKSTSASGMITRSGRIRREPVELRKDFTLLRKNVTEVGKSSNEVRKSLTEVRKDFTDVRNDFTDVPVVVTESVSDNVSAAITELPDITSVKAEVTEAEMLTDVKQEEETAEPAAVVQRKKRSKVKIPEDGAATVKRTKREKQEIKCERCQKEFKRFHNLNKHLQTCADFSDGDMAFSQFPAVHPQIFNCEQCDKRFTTKYALILHQRMHAGDFRNLCSVCGKGFVNITALKRHMDYHVRRFNCEMCGRHFSRLRELKMHQRRHTGERPYMCPYCGKSYPTASHLRYHMPFHNEVKAHVCSICQKGFHHSKAFRNHFLQHSGEKPYTCLLCPERFSSRYRLMKHQATEHVSDSKNLSCETCGKMFLTIGNLKSHQRSHSNDRPHKCDRCEKQYKNIYDLVIHKKKKHESGFPSS